MDPQVLEKQAGPCPICKMPLAKITLDKKQVHIIRLNEEQMKLANVKVDLVKMSSIGKETILSGVFAVNQDRTEQISARINGRIEKLYHKTLGEEIKQGDPAFDIYSRDLLLAQEEYLITLEKSDILGGKSVIASAKNKLLLWGLSENQITDIEKTKEAKISVTIYSPVSGTITEIPVREGDIVNEGAKIYQVADLSSVWVEAQVYSNELGILHEGSDVEIIPDAFPEEATEGIITFSNPELQTESKINLVRVEVKNPSGKFKPGMQAYVIHHSDEKKAIVLPIDAVIRDSKHDLVWIQNKEGGFESRTVKTGIENKSRVEIISGLNIGDKIVVSGMYLINSEYVFKLGMMPMQ
jgi:Cu(I)/Ag(I) efflux system membrane fusion protein